MSDVTVRPAFHSAYPDSGDATKFGPTAWNAPRVFSGGTDGQVVARDSASPTGASWASPVASILHQATVTLNNDQIKTLPSTPVTLLPAPADGYGYLCLLGTFRLNIGVAYGNVGHAADPHGVTALFVRGLGYIRQAALSPLSTGVPGGVVMIAANQVAAQAGDADVIASVATAGQVYADGGTFDESLYVAIDNYDAAYEVELGDFTGGHADNTLTMTLAYLLINLTTGVFV